MEKSKAFFSSAHFLSYSIKLPLLRSEVRRKDEDFDHLQKYLSQAYPNVIVPGKKPHKAKKYNEQKYITKRAYVLQRFIIETLRSRILRGDSYLMSFLTETDEKKYNKEISAMSKQIKVIRIDDIITQDGRLKLEMPYVDKIRQTLSMNVRSASDQTQRAYVYLHQQMARLAQDLINTAQTIETIRDTFDALNKTTFDLQKADEADQANQESIRYFYKINKETFNTWSVQMQQMSEHIKSTQTRFFENFAHQGERIGELMLDLREIDMEHTQRMDALTKKQLKLFNGKDVTKWENPDAARLPKPDQDELLRDQANLKIIAVAEQQALWKLRQTHCLLIESLYNELRSNQNWAVSDMTLNFADLIQFMKQSASESSQMWVEYEQKLNPYQVNVTSH